MLLNSTETEPQLHISLLFSPSSISSQLFPLWGFLVFYLHIWPKESYTQEILVIVSSFPKMWGRLFIPVNIPNLHSAGLAQMNTHRNYKAYI